MESLPELIDLKCRNCGAAISPKDISYEIGAARCGHCRSLYTIPSTGRSIPRPQVSLPPGFTVETVGNVLSITRRWFRPSAWMLVFFALFWNGFMVVWHGIALTTGTWIMSLFGLLHTGVGLWLIYYVAALFANRTVIRASPALLEVAHGPVPWRGNLRMEATGIGQLYCTEKIRRSKNGTRTGYRVEAILPDNRRKVLVEGLDDADHALFIEQQIERHLRIADRPVEGEHGR